LAGPVNPDAARSLDKELGIVGRAVFAFGEDVLIDCGRVTPGAGGQREAIRAADHVITVLRPDTAGIAHAHWALHAVEPLAPAAELSLVIVGGSGTFKAHDIERALGVGVLGEIPFDSKAASLASGMPGSHRAFARSAVIAAARHIIRRLVPSRGSADQMGGTVEPTCATDAPSAHEARDDVVSTADWGLVR
jgi:hypothetical protein